MHASCDISILQHLLLRMTYSLQLGDREAVTILLLSNHTHEIKCTCYGTDGAMPIFQDFQPPKLSSFNIRPGSTNVTDLYSSSPSALIAV